MNKKKVITWRYLISIPGNHKVVSKEEDMLVQSPKGDMVGQTTKERKRQCHDKKRAERARGNSTVRRQKCCMCEEEGGGWLSGLAVGVCPTLPS